MGVMAVPSPSRALLRYHGGKWDLAPWIIKHFPSHRVYVEPFGGAASVLLQKPRSWAEVYNDLDGEIVNLFRVLRNQPKDIEERVQLTPFSREEFKEAYTLTDNSVERAVRLLIRSHMGFAGAATHGHKTGFRSKSINRGSHPASQWSSFFKEIAIIADRLQGVVIENRPAVKVIQQQDSPQTLFYVDPPYVFSTRDKGDDYRHEMSDQDHRELATILNAVEGMVVLSGYSCSLYDELYAGWRRAEIEALADVPGGNKSTRGRVEVLWINPTAVKRSRAVGLFHGR